MIVCVSDVKRRQEWMNRWGEWEKNPVMGNFFVFHFSNSSIVPLKIKGFGSYFHAHGLGLVQDGSSIIVAAVNHAVEGDRIELFDYIPGSSEIIHYETVVSDLLYSINDVIPLDRKRFYATNDSKYYKGIMFYLEKIFCMPWSFVVYRDSKGNSK
jgi:hypothetical protein